VTERIDLRFETADSGALVVRIRGPVSLAGLISVAPQVHGHPDFSATAGVLYDMRGTELAHTAEELRRFAELIAGRTEPEGYRVAYLVAEGLGVGYARMFQALAEGVHGRVRQTFGDEAEALAWLRAGAVGSDDP
jgi:hypothetical protein